MLTRSEIDTFIENGYIVRKEVLSKPMSKPIEMLLIGYSISAVSKVYTRTTCVI